MDEGKSSLEDDMPITRANRRLMCENSKFSVYFDHVIDQAGFEIRDYLVVAPRNTGKNFVTGVAVLPVVDGNVGLVRIFRPALQAYCWEIPHGFVDEGETNKASATRELLEETGLVADPARIASLGFIAPDSGIIAARVELFAAEGGKVEKRGGGELGVREFRFFPFEVFERMIMDSGVQDTFTLAAWCRYQLLRRHKPPGDIS